MSDWREQSCCENVSSVIIVVICAAVSAVTSEQLSCLLFHFHGSLKIEVKQCDTVCMCVCVSLEVRDLMNDGAWLLHESQHCS